MSRLILGLDGGSIDKDLTVGTSVNLAIRFRPHNVQVVSTRVPCLNHIINNLYAAVGEILNRWQGVTIVDFGPIVAYDVIDIPTGQGHFQGEIYLEADPYLHTELFRSRAREMQHRWHIQSITRDGRPYQAVLNRNYGEVWVRNGPVNYTHTSSAKRDSMVEYLVHASKVA